MIYYHLDLDPDSDPDFDKASTNCIATTNREKSQKKKRCSNNIPGRQASICFNQMLSFS
jgi:hypothetical protein